MLHRNHLYHNMPLCLNQRNLYTHMRHETVHCRFFHVKSQITSQSHNSRLFLHCHGAHYHLLWSAHILLPKSTENPPVVTPWTERKANGEGLMNRLSFFLNFLQTRLPVRESSILSQWLHLDFALTPFLITRACLGFGSDMSSGCRLQLGSRK